MQWNWRLAGDENGSREVTEPEFTVYENSEPASFAGFDRRALALSLTLSRNDGEIFGTSFNRRDRIFN